MATAVNGFKKCGIWPYDPNVFSESDFAASLVTDIPLTQALNPAASVLNNELATVSETTSPSSPAKVLPSSGVETELISAFTPNGQAATIHTAPLMASVASPEPGCSTWFDKTEFDRRPTTQQSKCTVASPQEIMPLPATRKTSRVTRKRGKTAIITASPFKNELEEMIKKKKLAEENKQKRLEVRKLKLKKTQKNPKAKKSKAVSRKKASRRSSNEDSDTDTENTPCLYCRGLYLDSNEGWAGCSLCGKWAHCSCAGVDDEDDEAIFTCEFCQA